MDTHREVGPFIQELEALKVRLMTLGGLAEERLRVALRALVERNHEILAAVIAGDRGLDRLQMDVDDRCFLLIARYHPVASDLRTIVSALKISADLERVGDLAVNICEAGRRYLLHPLVKPLIDVPRMGDLASKMLREALDAFVGKDVTLAQGVLAQDDWLDALKNQIFRELLTYMLSRADTIEPAIELILICRHLERIGDHATNIAEDVIFLVEGRDVRHGVARPVPVERRRPAQSAPV